ncbi:hypothetical protein [Nocardia sp. NPDC060259]|uniref:hypothetical protein n=1 Tax=Nocardia sp. NPDC060259 TaxID=3347088 RepID=UPI00364BAD08
MSQSDNEPYFDAAHKAFVGNHAETLRELTPEEREAVRAQQERTREIGELGGRADT